VLRIIAEGLKVDPQRYHKMVSGLVGVSEETTTGVKRLYEMQKAGTPTRAAQSLSTQPAT
jgi:adenosylhomocysteinase